MVMAQIYHTRVLPNAHLGKLDISGKPLASLAAIPAADMLPARLTLRKGAAQTVITPAQLGIRIDVPATLRSTDELRRWLPLASLVTRYDVPLRLRFDQQTYRQAAARLATTFSRPAIPEHIAFRGSSFAIALAASGYTVDDARLKDSLAAALQNGSSIVGVPTTPIAARQKATDLAGQLQQLQLHLGTAISFVYHGRTVRPGKAEVGSWFVPKDQTMAPSATAARVYIDTLARQLGTTIANPDDLAAAAVYAVSKDLPRTFAVVPAGNGTILRTYCTAVRGIDASVLSDLTGKLAATYYDTRGWNNGGRIAFQHVGRGCQYTVWMSAASQMTSFGAICDAYYSCQTGTDVVLNYDRWTSATPPWDKTNGTLEDYRTLMINHETGHRLGFPDNPICPGAGQPAPVMMQQSVNLKGCVFNIWPRAAELAQLNIILGLPSTAAVSE